MDLGKKAVDSWYSENKYFNFQGTNKDMAASTKACNYLNILILDIHILVNQLKCLIQNYLHNWFILNKNDPKYYDFYIIILKIIH